MSPSRSSAVALVHVLAAVAALALGGCWSVDSRCRAPLSSAGEMRLLVLVTTDDGAPAQPNDTDLGRGARAAISGSIDLGGCVASPDAQVFVDGEVAGDPYYFSFDLTERLSAADPDGPSAFPGSRRTSDRRDSVRVG